MRSPNPSRIINAPDFEMFRWDTLQARRTQRAKAAPVLARSRTRRQFDDQRPDRDPRRTRGLRSLGRGRVYRLGIRRRAAVLQAARDRSALRRRRLSRQRTGRFRSTARRMSNWGPVDPDARRSRGRSRLSLGARSQRARRARRFAVRDQQPRSSARQHERRVPRSAPRPQQPDRCCAIHTSTPCCSTAIARSACVA